MEMTLGIVTAIAVCMIGLASILGTVAHRAVIARIELLEAKYRERETKDKIDF